MANVVKPAVLVAATNSARAAALSSHLLQADVVHVGDGESLLRESHLRPPDVLVLYTDFQAAVPLGELMGILRSREDLSTTRFVAVGTQGLGALLSAGADALMSDGAAPEALAFLIGNMLRRTREQRELQEKNASLLKKLDAWEHEERVRDQLVHMLVHDLKNPIAAVLGLLEIVEDDERLPKDMKELVHLSREETQHLLHLSVNMLDVRKIQAGKMNLDFELMFSPMLREVIDLAQNDVGAGLRERRLTIEVSPNLSPVRADPDILRRIFANLLSNAMKHTTAGGHIDVAVMQVGEDLQFSMRDDGEGIPAEDIPNLFAAFEQSRLTLHGRFDTGMGLAFCKLAVEGHGGRIWVESVRGQGSLFTFVLPLARDEEDDDDFAELVS
ncbi:two-component sensor histidine kinase [Deinococcus irradiatisoli]|uniref:histidine kinase n=1 Tax=Deinococcus irradiatisoli TaxID=2202254 RepID=A0A2Z3JI71_9DEIO|nr:HAMP domain-containing sensor histidine kinase [Deinococcus irradiatisoli]AWN23090.1 two-component sensor histidine kinase [Deinococcus irradiatisoli]